MDQSITHSFVPGLKEDATKATPQAYPNERSVPAPQVAAPPPVMQPEPLLRAIDKKPALRLLARGFDLLLFTVLFEAALAYLWPPIREGSLMLLALIPGFLIYLLLDAIFMAGFGATPGKYLLRIRVVPAEGGRVQLPGAMKRSFRVGWKGLAMGLPGVNLFTLHAARKRLLVSGRTLWDQQGNFYVLHGRIGVMRALVFIICSVFLVMTGSIIRLLGQDRSPGSTPLTLREMDAVLPTPATPAPPVLAGTPPDAAQDAAMLPEEAQGGSAQLAHPLPAAAAPVSGEAVPTVVAPVAKTPVHARHAGRHSIHHTIHPAAQLPASRPMAHHQGAHHGKQQDPQIASHLPGRQHAHDRTALTSPRDSAAVAATGEASAKAAPAARNRVSLGLSTVAVPGRHTVHQELPPVDPATGGGAVRMPEKSAPVVGTASANNPASVNNTSSANNTASVKDPNPVNTLASVTDPAPADTQAWQPITADQVLAADDTPAPGSAAISAGRDIPAASRLGTPTQVDGDRPARPAATDAGLVRQGQDASGGGRQPVTETSGDQTFSPAGAPPATHVPAALPMTGLGSGGQVSTGASAQISDPPVNVTPQVY